MMILHFSIYRKNTVCFFTQDDSIHITYLKQITENCISWEVNQYITHYYLE